MFDQLADFANLTGSTKIEPVNIGLALMFGAGWRDAFGHNWKPPEPQTPDFIEAHARTILHVLGAIFAALIVYLSGGSIYATAAAAVLTPAYFAIGNGAVLRGPTDPAWPYVRALLLKYVGPAILANVILWTLGHHTAISGAGCFAALGYFGFWKPDLNGTDPWNHKAEALSGAAWFSLLALNVEGFL